MATCRDRAHGTVLSSADVAPCRSGTAKRTGPLRERSLYLSIDIDAMDAGYLPGTGSRP
jgi:arginase family enzyme